MSSKFQASLRTFLLERLEERSVPTSSPWFIETFDSTDSKSFQENWLSFGDGSAFSTSPNAGLVGGSLQSNGSSAMQARVWAPVELPANATVSVDVLADSLIPVAVLGRGRNLDSHSPSYYAVSVVRGLQIQLLKVIDGTATVLATLNSQTWLSNQWIRLSLTMTNDQIFVHVLRYDTREFLNSLGQWQTGLTHAMQVSDGSISQGGFAGLSRAASYAGLVRFDNFQTAPAWLETSRQTIVQETYTRPAPGGLPEGWTQWSQSAAQMRVSTSKSLTETASLGTTDGGAGEVRSWLQVPLPNDGELAVSIRADETTTAYVFLRGTDLASPKPTFYSVTLNLSGELQLRRTVAGNTEILKSVTIQRFSGPTWLRLHFDATEDQLRVSLVRHDTGQYLDTSGHWCLTATWAISTSDSQIAGPGYAGVGRSDEAAGHVAFDHFTFSQANPLNIASPNVLSFDHIPDEDLPSEWSSWTTGLGSGFQIVRQNDGISNGFLISKGMSDHEARIWLTNFQQPNIQASVDVYLDSLAPARLIFRAFDLDRPQASYYALQVTRSLELQLLRVIHGDATIINSLVSSSWVSNIWIRLIVMVQDTTIQIQVIRLDSLQYLNRDGAWQADPAIAISLDDDTLLQGGSVGLLRPASYSGTLFFDNFEVTSLTPGFADSSFDHVNDPCTQVAEMEAEELPDGIANAPSANDKASAPPGSSSLPDAFGNTDDQTDAGIEITKPDTGFPLTSSSSLAPIPKHYSHVRIAQFAYHGTPIGPFEQKLLAHSIDLVFPNVSYLDQIAATAPGTPQFIYSNASNIYRELLRDWLSFADEKGYDRESAFYHVTQPMQFTGNSASSWPVNWFWNVAMGDDSNLRPITYQARKADYEIQMPQGDQFLFIGNVERFREINFEVVQPASPKWMAVLEYVTAVDNTGRPAAWSRLPLTSDTTRSFQRSGQMVFDPPSNWVTSRLENELPLYYVRLRVVNNEPGPMVSTILGRDYVQAQGGSQGIIPAFDKVADRDGDGYLNDDEYAYRSPGKDARFYYESRAFYPAYGQNRFATNVANRQFREWAVDYTERFLANHSIAAGVFMDNSISKLAFDPMSIEEPLANYAEDYAELLERINQRIAPKWIIANVAGGGFAIDSLAAKGISYLEEFVIRPMSASYSQFEDVARNLERRLALSDGRGYAILDSLATNGSMIDARVQIATLAYYYLLADPLQTMLIFNGGDEPNTSWTRHWSPAVEFDVGMPMEQWREFVTGRDPADSEKTYKVYQRMYQNALVLYKPLSYYRGVAGTTSDETVTTHSLDRLYRPLNADGTLGSPISQIRLRNGEGAILVPV